MLPTAYTGLDTNVVLRAMLQDDTTQSPVAAEILRELSREHVGFITQVALAEIYWVLLRSVKLSRKDTLAVMRHIIETESFEFDDDESVARALSLAEEGADFGDALIQGTMELFGIERTVTFDRKASKHLGWSLLEDLETERLREQRLEAIRDAAGSMDYPEGYLEELRKDWPD